MKKRVIALLLASFMVFALAACSQGGNTAQNATPQTNQATTAASEDEAAAPADETATEENTAVESSPAAGSDLHVSIASTPETIDPNMNSSSDGGTYIVHLFEGLMRYKWDGSGIEPGTAESYTVSDDGLVWTFKIRDDAKWSDGEPVTASDFVYSWRRLVDPEMAAPYAMDMGIYIKNAEKIISGELPIEDLGVQAIDPATLEVTLEGPCPYFDEIAAFPTMYPLRQDTIEANGDRWTREASTYISNGPFKMESFNLDQSLVMVPNENYHGRDKVIPERITFHFLADEVAMYSAFQAGEVSFIKQFPEEEKDAVKADGTYLMLPLLGTYYLDYNYAEGPTTNVNVRKALTLAIDTEYIANVVRQGSVLPAEGYVGEGFLDVDGKQFRDVGTNYLRPSEYEARKEEARQAMADAGFPNGEGFPKIEYMYNEGTGHQVIAEAIQNMWKEVLNIDVELVSQEWNVFLDTRRKGDFQVARDGWLADYNDPMNLLALFKSGSGNNNAQYSNPQYDEYLAIATSSGDRAVRMDAMHKAEDLMLGEEWVCAPIYYYTEETAISPSFKGMTSTPLGYQFFYTSYLE